jgi:hypothetical protein
VSPCKGRVLHDLTAIDIAVLELQRGDCAITCAGELGKGDNGSIAKVDFGGNRHAQQYVQDLLNGRYRPLVCCLGNPRFLLPVAILRKRWERRAQWALQSALNAIKARAGFDGPERKVFIRIAELNGKLYRDLANSNWQAVEIDDNGWRMVSNPPVRFRRAAGMQPLPLPIEGKSINTLRPFLNV